MSVTVLYIEDSRLNLRLIRKVLRIMEYDMIGAETGEQGLQLVKRSNPDLILLDINLPDINGYEVLQRIRQTPQEKTVPVVALTADVTNKRKCMEAGFDGYLNKPVSKGRLLRTVAQFTSVSMDEHF